MANKSWRGKTQQAGRFGAKREGGSGQTVGCFGFQEDFWLRLWSVRAGAAKFNWMSLELRGRTGAAVTVPPHRTGFSVPSEFSSHTPQAVDGRTDGRAQTEPIPFRVKVSKVTVVTPPTPDPRSSWSEQKMLQTPVFDCPSLVPRLRRCMRPHVKIELTTAHNVYCA